MNAVKTLLDQREQQLYKIGDYLTDQFHEKYNQLMKHKEGDPGSVQLKKELEEVIHILQKGDILGDTPLSRIIFSKSLQRIDLIKEVPTAFSKKVILQKEQKPEELHEKRGLELEHHLEEICRNIIEARKDLEEKKEKIDWVKERRARTETETKRYDEKRTAGKRDKVPN